MPPRCTGIYVGPDASQAGLPYTSGVTSFFNNQPQLLDAFQATFECPQTQTSLEISSITLPHEQTIVQCASNAESFQAKTPQETLVQMSLKSPKATEKPLISCSRFSKNVRAILPANQSSLIGSLSGSSAVLLTPVKHPQTALSENTLRPGVPMIVMQSENSAKIHPMSNGLLSVSSSMNGVMTSRHDVGPSSSVNANSAPVTSAMIKKTMVERQQVFNNPKKRDPTVKMKKNALKADSKPKSNMAAGKDVPNGVVVNGFTSSVSGSTTLNHLIPSKRSSEPENGVSPKKKSKKKLGAEAINAVLMSAGKGIIGGGFSIIPSANPLSAAPLSEAVHATPALPEAPSANFHHGPQVLLTGVNLSAPTSTIHPVRTANSHSTSLTAEVMKALRLRESSTGLHPALENSFSPLVHSDAKMQTCTSPSKPLAFSVVFPTEKAPVVSSSLSSNDNGAVRKKHRLILESGERKTQQIKQQEHTIVEKNAAVEVSSQIMKEIKVEEPNSPEPSKPVKKTRKPRSDKGISPRIPKAKKSKVVLPVEKKVPVMLELKRKESDEQRILRLKKLASKWATLPEESLDWLIATKSVDCLKVIRWLRLVDRAFTHAESAKNMEKMLELRDSKIQAIMDLEKLQAPFEPRLQHFVHPDDVSMKNHLLEKHCAGKTLSVRETRWLKGHYDRLCAAEKELPPSCRLAKARKNINKETPTDVMNSGSKVVNGNERGNFVNGLLNENNHAPRPSTSSNLGEKPQASRTLEERTDGQDSQLPLQISACDVQSAHQFVRKFPDSTRAVIEMNKDEVPCAVILLIQQPNSKAVHIKKRLKPPEQPFRSKDEALASAASELSYLSSKYLGMPQFPVQVRYPLSAGYLDEEWKDTKVLADPSFHEFNRTLRTWEAIHSIDESSLLSEEVKEDAAIDARTRPSEDGCSIIQKLKQQTGVRRPVDLTMMANDPVGQRRYLCWELRHLSQQYWELDACQREREVWHTKMLNTLKECAVPNETMLKAARCIELTRDGLKRPKSSTVLVNKTIKMGEQVRDVLESYKKERPMTRRKKAARMNMMGI